MFSVDSLIFNSFFYYLPKILKKDSLHWCCYRWRHLDKVDPLLIIAVKILLPIVSNPGKQHGFQNTVFTRFIQVHAGNDEIQWQIIPSPFWTPDCISICLLHFSLTNSHGNRIEDLVFPSTVLYLSQGSPHCHPSHLMKLHASELPASLSAHVPFFLSISHQVLLILPPKFSSISQFHYLLPFCCCPSSVSYTFLSVVIFLKQKSNYFTAILQKTFYSSNLLTGWRPAL